MSIPEKAPQKVMPSFQHLARATVLEASPYVPGKPIEEIRERFGLAQVVKLASNENAVGPSPKAAEAMARSFAELHRYPEGGSTRLRKALAVRYGVDPSCVMAGSGSDELIELIARTFLDPGDEVIVSEHAFVRYKMAARLSGAKVIEVPMTGYRHDARGMARAVTPRTKLLFLANPNNPTGTYVNCRDVDALLETVPADRLVILDEAYHEYAAVYEDYPDAVQLLRRGRANIVSLRTFSKAYGLAALRVGYAIADPGVISLIDRVRPPFNLSSPAQAACEAALQDASHVKTCVRLNGECKKWLCLALEQGGIEFVPSATNCVLIRTRVGSRSAFEALLARGIIVRPMEEYGYPDHIRVTVGTRAEMELFLREFLAVDRRAAF